MCLSVVFYLREREREEREKRERRRERQVASKAKWKKEWSLEVAGQAG